MDSVLPPLTYFLEIFKSNFLINDIFVTKKQISNVKRRVSFYSTLTIIKKINSSVYFLVGQLRIMQNRKKCTVCWITGTILVCRNILLSISNYVFFETEKAESAPNWILSSRNGFARLLNIPIRVYVHFYDSWCSTTFHFFFDMKVN